MFHSVRWRLVFYFLLVGLAAALAVGLVTLLIANSYFRQQEIDYLTRNADEIAYDVRPVLQYDNQAEQSLNSIWPGIPFVWDGKQQLQSAVQFYSFLGQERVAVLDSEGNVLADSGGAPPIRVVELAPPSVFSPNSITIITTSGVDVAGFPSAHLFQVQPAQYGCGFQLDAMSEAATGDAAGTYGEQSELIVRVPVKSENDEHLGYIQLSEGPAYGRPILRGIRLALAGGLGAAVLLAVAVGALSARQFTRPLAALGEAAEQMAAGDLSARAPNHRKDEFGRLARQFNQTADQLQKTVERLAADREALRRFIADASHELRTPLTALKTFNTIWSREPGQAGRPDQEMLAANAAQIERLDLLTQGLLDLSRLDAELSLDEFEQEDLRPLLERALQTLSPLMQKKNLSLNVQLPAGPVVVSHDPVYLRRAVDNLLSNALKFTPPGSQIGLGLAEDESEVRLWVRDSGPGIPADEFPYIFDRFYRGKQAAGTEGSGLGLAIVKAVAQAHGGWVEVDCADGCRFTLHLPK